MVVVLCVCVLNRNKVWSHFYLDFKRLSLQRDTDTGPYLLLLGNSVDRVSQTQTKLRFPSSSCADADLQYHAQRVSETAYLHLVTPTKLHKR